MQQATPSRHSSTKKGVEQVLGGSIARRPKRLNVSQSEYRNALLRLAVTLLFLAGEILFATFDLFHHAGDVIANLLELRLHVSLMLL